MLPYKVYLLVAVFTNLLQLIYFGWWRHQPIRKKFYSFWLIPAVYSIASKSVLNSTRFVYHLSGMVLKSMSSVTKLSPAL